LHAGNTAAAGGEDILHVIVQPRRRPPAPAPEGAAEAVRIML
jgi:hypothetical protein